MSKHFRFGGSTAARTLNCGAWQDLSINMPSGPPSLAALEGTMMHMMFELGMLQPDYEPIDLLGQSQVIEGVELTITDKHIDKVYTAYDTQADFDKAHDIVLSYYEVMMSSDDDTGGTADVIGMNIATNVFAVGDLKTGDGHMVWAEDNEQLLFYAWQAVLHYNKNLFAFNEDTKIILYIIQPSDRRDDPLDQWTVTLKQVLDYGEAFKLAMRVSKSGRAEPCAGSWCAYCPAQATCPAKTGMIAASKRIPADSTELKDLIAALGMVDDVESWCRSVRKVAHEQLEQGVKLDGFKLVAKRASRIWNNEVEALSTFKKARKMKADDYMIEKMKSPAQIEKQCKALDIDFEKYQSMISLHSSGTTLVKNSDKRQSALPLAGLTAMAASIK